MSDSQKAKLALTLLVESCTAASTGLSEVVTDIENYPTSDFATLRTDFLSILSIIYASTTKVALSLKPSSPQPKASLVPLKDLTNNVAALVHSIRLMRAKEGATVIQEYEKIAHGVIHAVRSLGITLQSLSPAGDSSTEDYLVRTGEIHELIDTVKKSGGLSLNNYEAVRRIFSLNQDSLTDAAEEIQEMCKSAQANDPEVEDDFDDGWAELGILSNQPLSPTELLVTEKVKALIKLGLLLHKRINKDILSPTAPMKENHSLDRLATSSDKLAIAFDDLISSTYAPQQASTIKAHLESFQRIVNDFRTTISSIQAEPLEVQMDKLSISKQDHGKTEMWFTTCFEQISKAATSVSEALQSLEELAAP